MNSHRTPSVVILMGTYNGSLYLSEQLNSLEKQTYKNWRLIASDDGSSDETIDILKSYQSRWSPGKLEIRFGPQKGFCQNFMSLVNDGDIIADYYAFSDQDDIWFDNKLERAISIIEEEQISEGTAILYGARTNLVDQYGNFQGISPLYKKLPSFGNALIQSIAGGNTMVFNHTLKGFISVDSKYSVISHDWWAYLLVEGVGGRLIFDPVPVLAYRQHGGNIVGGKKGFKQKLLRFKKLFDGEFKEWNDQRLVTLDNKKENLTELNQKILKDFLAIRKSSWFKKILWITHSSVKRQYFIENVAFFFALLANKI